MRQPETRRDTPEPSDPTALPDELLNARVRFWRCLNRDHRTVTWEGGVATCPDCGLTSDMTRAYAQGIRTHCREEIEREVRDYLADEIDEAAEEYAAQPGDWYRCANFVRGLSMLSLGKPRSTNPRRNASE